MRYVNVNEVLRFAQELFDTAPGPGSMGIILQAMYDTLQQVAQLRADLGDVTELSWWERALLSVAPGESIEEAAEDRARLMQQWDRRANEFWHRFEEYSRITEAAQRGEFTGEFTGEVVQGVLRGDTVVAGSEVTTPDAIEPFRLWNELNEYLIGTDASARIADWAQSVVERFGQSARAAAEEGVIGLTDKAIERIKKEADTYVSEARDMLREEAEEAQQKVEAGIGIAIGLGLLAVTVAVVAARKKRRR